MSEVTHMRKVLFYTFMVIFLVTAFVTLAGITNFLPMESHYLDNLFHALILEVVGGVSGLFIATFLKKNGILGKKNGDIEIQLIFPETVDTTIPNLPEAEYSFIDAESRERKFNQECLVYPKGEGDSPESHYIKIKDAPLDKILFVKVVMEGIPYQGAQHLGSRQMYLKSHSKKLGIPEEGL